MCEQTHRKHNLLLYCGPWLCKRWFARAPHLRPKPVDQKTRFRQRFPTNREPIIRLNIRRYRSQRVEQLKLPPQDHLPLEREFSADLLLELPPPYDVCDHLGADPVLLDLPSQRIPRTQPPINQMTSRKAAGDVSRCKPTAKRDSDKKTETTRQWRTESHCSTLNPVPRMASLVKKLPEELLEDSNDPNRSKPINTDAQDEIRASKERETERPDVWRRKSLHSKLSDSRPEARQKDTVVNCHASAAVCQGELWRIRRSSAPRC